MPGFTSSTPWARISPGDRPWLASSRVRAACGTPGCGRRPLTWELVSGLSASAPSRRRPSTADRCARRLNARRLNGLLLGGTKTEGDEGLRDLTSSAVRPAASARERIMSHWARLSLMVDGIAMMPLAYQPCSLQPQSAGRRHEDHRLTLLRRRDLERPAGANLTSLQG
jgi:hypothetical protein